MRTSRFLKQLQKVIPEWVENGIINSGTDQAILAYEKEKLPHKTSYLSASFGVLGAVLLGVGIISFFAANWDAIPKWFKLLALFCAFWAAYAGANYFFNRQWQGMANAMVLLASILFGSNIMLMAQIYHIDSHYPDGVLTWSLGAFFAAYLLRSQPAMILSIGLAVLWCSFEIFEFNHGFYWPFLLYMGVFSYVAIKNNWRLSFHLIVVSFIYWGFIQIIPHAHRWLDHEWFYILECYFLIYAAFFLLGFIFSTYKQLASFSLVIQRYCALAAGIIICILTIPRWFSQVKPIMELTRIESWGTLLTLNLLAVAAVIVLAVINYFRTEYRDNKKYLIFGYGVLAALLLTLVLKSFSGKEVSGVLAVLFNIEYFLLLFWLIYSGIQREDRGLVNIGFLFFAIALLARYIDTFWTLLNRSYFLMIGGVILIAGGMLFEKQRRRLTQQIVQSKEGASK